MHATTVKNKITQRDNYKEIMSVIVVVLLLTLTLIAIFSAIDQLGISEMGRIARDLTPGSYTNLTLPTIYSVLF
ncbi:two-component system connector SafA [Escherichia coli]|uniref:two-component system connector SafA n=1 Tax=Escherichia coli TaxID=562 RepID=UPI00259C8975|nr:two-component system connector SafA [Escherichia coli]MDM4732558.1 two-component system connector SafA [Escherichia coli]